MATYRGNRRTVRRITWGTVTAGLVGGANGVGIALISNSWQVVALHALGVAAWALWAYAHGQRAGLILGGAQTVMRGGVYGEHRAS